MLGAPIYIYLRPTELFASLQKFDQVYILTNYLKIDIQDFRKLLTDIFKAL